MTPGMSYLEGLAFKKNQLLMNMIMVFQIVILAKLMMMMITMRT